MELNKTTAKKVSIALLIASTILIGIHIYTCKGPEATTEQNNIDTTTQAYKANIQLQNNYDKDTLAQKQQAKYDSIHK